MYTIRGANVNEVFPIAIHTVKNHGVPVSPRGEPTLELEHPVCTTYTNPTERVMLIEERDANPFFHLMESLWILAGRQDVEWLAQFNKRMRLYSDDESTFHAPYGYRMRKVYGFDQIEEAVDLLQTEPDTRRCVIQIWHPEFDLNVNSKDIPCNDTIFFKIRNGKLNMTVCNRSNDVIWGAYGANIVQFSMLQEYIAGKVGADVGHYNQVSDSFHVYSELDIWNRVKDIPINGFDPYRRDVVHPYPIMNNPDTWDDDLQRFLDETESSGAFSFWLYSNSFFTDVAIPMYCLWIDHKQHGNALQSADIVQASDWRMAARQWLGKREQL